jgi:nucleoside phosphorylase
VKTFSFPNFNGKHLLTPVFAPHHLYAKAPAVSSKLVIIFSPYLETILRRMLKLTSVPKNESIGLTASWTPKNLITPDRKMIIIRLEPGAPFSAAISDVAIHCGVNQILVLGDAGGIGKNLNLHDIVICTKAIRDEGTSHHYIAPSKYVSPSMRLTNAIAKELSSEGVKTIKGPTWTTDAIFAETLSEIRSYSDEGVLTVDMEAAAVFAVAKKRGVSAAAVFNISDIVGRKWSGIAETRTAGYNRLSKAAKVFSRI